MAETVRCGLERGLPKADMYAPEFRQRVAARVVARAHDREAEIIADAHKKAEKIVAESKRKAVVIVAGARSEAATIISHAQATAAAIVAHAQSTVFVRPIIQSVADRHGFSVDDLTGDARARAVTTARDEAMAAVHLCRPELSLSQIGQIFGNRGYSTVMYSIRRGMAAARMHHG